MYVTNTIKNSKQRMKVDGYKFEKNISNPNIVSPQTFTDVYQRHYLDTSNMCGDSKISV